MSGGKGGSASSQVQVPDWIKEPAQRNIARAEQVQQIGYMPYMGVDVAAPTPGMENLMRQRGRTAESLGIVGPGYDPMAGMPEVQNIGGVRGYSSFEPTLLATEMLAEQNPEQMRRYGALYTGTPTQQVDAMTPEQNAGGIIDEVIRRNGGDGVGESGGIYGRGNDNFNGPNPGDPGFPTMGDFFGSIGFTGAGDVDPNQQARAAAAAAIAAQNDGPGSNGGINNQDTFSEDSAWGGGYGY